MLFIDFETRSRSDIKTVGAYRYAEDKSTDVLCMAWAFDDKEVSVCKFHESTLLPSEIKEYIHSGGLIEAHNAFFERSIWGNICVPKYDWPIVAPEQWRCSAASCAYMGLPRSLENAGAALELTKQKDKEGKRVMMQLCRPRRPTNSDKEEWATIENYPEKFDTLYEYCKDDVDSERAIHQSVRSLSKKELEIWQLDQKMNAYGVAIDFRAVNAAIDLISQYTSRLEQEAKYICEGYFDSVNQRAKVLEWALELGEELPGYTKSEVITALKTVKHGKVIRVLQIRQQIGKTSTAKYKAMRDSMCSDGRIRDMLRYYGASTGRWSGKLVQFQNLPKGTITDMDSAVAIIKKKELRLIENEFTDVMGFFSSAIRGMVVPKNKHTLMVADFSSIEARTLAWLSDCEFALKQFEKGEDLYAKMSSLIFKCKLEDVTKDQRALGKAAVLGCGYGMGPNKFYATCLSYGIEVTETLATQAVSTYRKVYLTIKKYWRDTEYAAIEAVRTKRIIKANTISWFVHEDYLYSKLPSGRCMAYKSPRLKAAETPWGAETYKLCYMGEKVLGTSGKKWMEIDTYGGKLVENITQAVARDIMADAMLRLDKSGYKLMLSIHDEIIAEKEEELVDLDEYISIMTEVPEWAEGCPIEANGWTGKHYKKD